MHTLHEHLGGYFFPRLVFSMQHVLYFFHINTATATAVYSQSFKNHLHGVFLSPKTEATVISRFYGSTLATLLTHYHNVWTVKRSAFGTRVLAVLKRGLLFRILFRRIRAGH